VRERIFYYFHAQRLKINVLAIRRKSFYNPFVKLALSGMEVADRLNMLATTYREEVIFKSRKWRFFMTCTLQTVPAPAATLYVVVLMTSGLSNAGIMDLIPAQGMDVISAFLCIGRGTELS
jgi:hypothetical protein